VKRDRIDPGMGRKGKSDGLASMPICLSLWTTGVGSPPFGTMVIPGWSLPESQFETCRNETDRLAPLRSDSRRCLILLHRWRLLGQILQFLRPHLAVRRNSEGVLSVARFGSFLYSL
jgi:hypothetical protein